MFEFDSDRKRHSVIVEEHGVYKLYIKGADSEIMKRLDDPERQPYLEATQLALDEFSKVGLRTLVLAIRILTKDQFLSIEDEYNEAVKSVSRKQKLKSLAQRVEKDLVLLGCTAIEDNLQEKVPESIKRFLEANIKVWMITGDKFETAENIAACAGLTDSDTFIYRLRHDKTEEFPKRIKDMKRQLQQQKPGTRKAIIMDTTRNSSSESYPRIYFWKAESNR